MSDFRLKFTNVVARGHYDCPKKSALVEWLLGIPEMEDGRPEPRPCPLIDNDEKAKRKRKKRKKCNIKSSPGRTS